MLFIWYDCFQHSCDCKICSPTKLIYKTTIAGAVELVFCFSGVTNLCYDLECTDDVELSSIPVNFSMIDFGEL